MQPTFEFLPLAALDIDPLNARFSAHLTPIDPTVALLAQSMREVGQLQPIVVRANAEVEGRYYVTVGWRRCLAARSLNWDEITAIHLDNGSDGNAAASSAAENIARAAMHPVDTWLTIARLCDDHGFDLTVAARAIGLDPLLAPRMRYLARMSQTMLDQIRRAPALPSMAQLRVIAAASHATQDTALEGRTADPIVHWDRITAACKVSRIARARALFDPDKADIAWDEDMLAQPDDPERFTTQDFDGFMAAQTAALEEQAKRGKGRVMVAEVNEYGRIILPDGWQRAWGDIPKRWSKTDDRRVFKGLVRQGDDVGEVIAVLASPDTVRRTGAPATGAESAAKPPRPPITKAALRLIAEKQAEGVQQALTTFFDGDATRGLQALLAVFVLRNVSIDGGMHDLIGQIRGVLIDPDPDTGAMLALVKAVVARAVVFAAPEVFHHSGPAAHQYAAMVGAVMPRCDTPDILKGVSLSALQAIAQAHGIATHGTATELRKRLAGNLPDWRPDGYATAVESTIAVHDDADADADADVDADTDADETAEAAE